MRISIAVLLLTATLAGSSTAQTASPPCTEVDGKKNPELIPDDVAIRMAFSMLSDGSTSFAWATRVSFLSGFGLTDDQIARFLRAANDFRAAESAVIAKSKQLLETQRRNAPLSSAQVESLRANAKERVKACEDIARSLQADLGPIAWEKVLRFVNERIKPTLVHCM